MNADEIGRLQNTLEGAFPTAKLSPTKVFEAWSHSKYLVEFPNQRRADLARYCIDKLRDFPTLQQLEAAARTIMHRDQTKSDTCLWCDGTGLIHYTYRDGSLHRDGSLMFEGDPLHNPGVRIVKGKEIAFEYEGRPVMYASPVPCPACNH